MEISLSPLQAGAGRLYSAAVRDVSDRKAAEKKVQTQQQLRSLYEQQQHIALTLQRSLMGTPTPIPGLETASP